MPGLPLRVTGLRLQLGSVPTVDLAELALEPGTLTVLFGPSGAGKSTLLYLLSGLLVPDEGSVFWGGTDLAALGERQRDRWRGTQAGFVFQNFHLIDELTPLDNVRVTTLFAPRGAAGGKARARELLEQLRVPLDRSRTALLSRGEQQRVAIARALLGEQPVLFADEPTASLDRAAGQQVAKILRDAATIDGRTVVAASHDPDVVALADTVVTLDHGQPASIRSGVPA